MPINDIPPQKCKNDNMWAVPGTDLCLLHGGKIPATIAEATERVEAARARLRGETPIVYDPKALLIERIETKIAEYEESYESNGSAGDQGIVLGLELALEIINSPVYQKET